jgi:hypothetical protein
LLFISLVYLFEEWNYAYEITLLFVYVMYLCITYRFVKDWTEILLGIYPKGIYSFNIFYYKIIPTLLIKKRI